MRPILTFVLVAGLALISSSASGASRPDLRWTYVTDPPSVLPPQAQFTVAIAVANDGSGRAAASVASVALSADARLDRTDLVLGSRRFPRLRPGSETVLGLRVRVPASTSPGEYFLVGCLDAPRRIRETTERNNCFAGATLLSVVVDDLSPPPSVGAAP